MNYNVLKKLFDLLIHYEIENNDNKVVKITTNESYVDVEFEIDNLHAYSLLMDEWNCDTHVSNNTYVRFYLN